MRHLLSRIRAFFQTPALDRDFDQELDSHLAMLAEDYARRGMSPNEAMRAARVQLGGAAQLREAHRAVRGLPFLDTLFQDICYTFRTLRKNPGFTALAVLTLAIGVGVNAAVFTVYDAAFLRPLQAADPDRLVQLAYTGRNAQFPYTEFAWYRDHVQSLSGLAAMSFQGFSMSGAGAAPPAQSGIASATGLQFPQTTGASEPVSATVVSGNYFQVLGAHANYGRIFLAEEDSPSAQPVVLLSDRFWERRFARDPGVLGRTIFLNGTAATIIGIARRDFGGTWLVATDLWMPISLKVRAFPAIDDGYRLYGRLAPGVAPGQAREELNALDAALVRGGSLHTPREPKRFVVGTVSLGGQPGDKPEIAQTVVMLGSVGLVLLIACANVASLLLARSAARQREIAIRLAIGASRLRLIRQLLTENAVTSLCACAAGILFSRWTLTFLMTEMAASPWASLAMPALNFQPDHRVLLYLLFLAVLTTLLFGLAPALEASRPNLSSGLKDESVAFGVRLRKSRLRDWMVGAQVAVCLVLLIAAGLLAHASARALAVDLGFDYRNILSLDLEFPHSTSLARIRATRGELAQELARLPEVQSLAVASRMPLVHGGMRRFAVAPNGGAPDSPYAIDAWATGVTPSYFETLRIPIVRGRKFLLREGNDGTNYDGVPVIVSETTARLFWPGQDPIGKRIAFGAGYEAGHNSEGAGAPHSASSIVIGVARDVRGWRLDRVDPTNIYLPVTSAFGNANTGVIAMRTRGDEGRALTAVRRLLQSSYPDLQASIGDSRTAISTQTAFIGARLGALGAAIIGSLGLMMTAVGIYGTVGFAVTQRTQEIGVRMALGATHGEVLRLMLAETMRPVAAGAAVGFPLSTGVSRLMHSILFGLSTLDPMAFLGVSAFLGVVALLAGFIPARRATRVDPMIALRYE